MTAGKRLRDERLNWDGVVGDEVEVLSWIWYFCKSRATDADVHVASCFPQVKASCST